MNADINKDMEALREFEASGMNFSEFYLARIEGLLTETTETTGY